MIAARVCLRAGDGWVVRAGAVIVYVSGDETSLGEVLETFEGAAGSPTEILERLGDLVADLTGLALVEIGDETGMTLRGDVKCRVLTTDSAPVVHTGDVDARTIDLARLARVIEISSVDTFDQPVDISSSLGEGCVRAGGFDVFLPGRHVGTQPSPRTTIDMPLSTENTAGHDDVVPVNFLVLADDGDDAGADLDPLPIEPDEAGADVEVPMVFGVQCSIGHINRVEAAYCSACGRRIQGTVNLKEGPRPLLGSLIFDDGTTVGLDKDCIIGRDPSGDPRVVEGRARPIAFDDEGRSVSRLHAEIRLQEWDTAVIDLGSSNGTFVRSANGNEWSRLTPGEPVILGDGWTVAIGQREFVFHRR